MSEVVRKRSPRAPSIDLQEAMELVEKIYQKERLHSAPVDVVAQHLGYKNANNGSALGTLASLRYYSLVERVKEGFLAVSKSYETYKFSPEESLRHEILVTFLKAPGLYKELLDRYDSGLPSEATLRFDLIQKGFSPHASENALSAFLRSVEFARYFAKNEQPAPNVEDEHGNKAAIERNIENEERKLERHSNVEKPSPPDVDNNQLVIAENSHDKIPVRLPGGRKAWLIVPTPFYEADKARMKAQIDLLLSEDEN